MFPAPLLSLLAGLPLLLVVAPLGLGYGQRASSDSAALGSKTWVGHYREVEEYLRTAECVALEDIGPKGPQGLPALRRCVLRPGGPVARMAWKSPPPGGYRGFRESYKTEIAAYELDKLLRMDMVPPSVERELQGHTGSAVQWVEDIVTLKAGTSGAADPARWEKELARMAMFDALIGNRDRNLANTLRDPLWNVVLIDHSRAFGTDAVPLPDLSQIDKELWARIEGLTRAQLDAALGAWLDKEQISAILDRRERMRAAIGRRP
ncbi:MAG: hypothetical protein ACRD1S_19940 [Vicinamibacterales bacterium]